MDGYIVTNNKENQKFLETLLPDELRQRVKVVDAKSGGYAETVATSLMYEEVKPVVLVVDPDPTEPASNEERRAFWQSQMRRTLATGIVMIAEPDVKTAISRDGTLLQEIIQFFEAALIQTR